MPSHWGHKALNIVSQSSPTGTQCLQAVGCADAGTLYGRSPAIAGSRSQFNGDEVVYCLARRRHVERRRILGIAEHRVPAQTAGLFLVEDNGYAISVPVEVQTPGGDSRSSSRLSRASGAALRRHGRPRQLSARCTSRRLRAASARARRSCTPRSIRPYSHSFSDDERLYKTPAERAEEATRDPITKFAAWLKTEELGPTPISPAIAKDVDRESNEAADAAIKAAEAGQGHGGALGLLAGRRSDIGRVRHAAPAPKASPTRWSPPSTAR